MIETSQELISAMRAEQTVASRVSILNRKASTIKFYASDVEPLLLDNKYIELWEGTDDTYSIPQIQNMVTHETGNYAIFEGDGIELDGSIQVMSKNAKNNQFGWYSRHYCGETNEWEADCNLFWMNQFYKNTDLNIVFSKVRNEYAIDFDVKITITVEDNDISSFLPTKDIEITYNIRDNTEPVYTIKDIPYGDYGVAIISSIVEVNVLKWSKPFSRAKIVDMYYGEMLEYSDDKIISLKGVKGVDLLNNSTESKEIELILSDENEEYNIFNPQRKVSKPRKRIKTFFRTRLCNR